VAGQFLRAALVPFFDDLWILYDLMKSTHHEGESGALERIQQVGATPCNLLSPSLSPIWAAFAGVFCDLRYILVTVGLDQPGYRARDGPIFREADF
jgi:hypothetical protein